MSRSVYLKTSQNLHSTPLLSQSSPILGHPLGPPGEFPQGPRGGIKVGVQQESCSNHYSGDIPHPWPSLQFLFQSRFKFTTICVNTIPSDYDGHKPEIQICFRYRLELLRPDPITQTPTLKKNSQTKTTNALSQNGDFLLAFCNLTLDFCPLVVVRLDCRRPPGASYSRQYRSTNRKAYNIK